MKIRELVVIMLAVALSFAPQFVNTSDAATGAYASKLISPTAGQVLYPGQKVKVEWNSVFPDVDLNYCEMEVFLSLDGGSTFNMCISVSFDPETKFFYWTVPNTPTNAAVLDIRFGCEMIWPESYSPQKASPFVIAKSPGQLY
jgi:hypothetical protein